jgi:hypothetical protein
MYDLIMSNGDRVGAGKFKPKGIEAKDYVEYDVIQKGNFLNLKPGSLSKKDPPAGTTAPAAKPGFVPSADKRQETISKQAALNSALAFVQLLQAAEALPMAKTTKQSDKADIVLGIVNRYTELFYHQSTGGTMDIPDPVEAVAAPSGGLAAAESDENWNEE